MSSLINLVNLAHSENQQQKQPTSSESTINPNGDPTQDVRVLRDHTRHTRAVTQQQPNQPSGQPNFGQQWDPPRSSSSPPSEDEEEWEYERDVHSSASSPHSSPHSTTLRDFNHNLQPDLPNLEALQQYHEHELLSVTQKHEQHAYDLQQSHKLDLQKRDTILAQYQATEKRLRARAKQQHDTNNNYQAPYYNKQQPECRDRGSPPDTHRGQLNPTTRRDQGHTPNPPWKPTPRDVNPTRSHTSHVVRSHNPTPHDVSPIRSYKTHTHHASPTRSHMSLDPLDGRQPDNRTTAGLKHIKIDIVQLQLNQNELEWRKTVTAATATLKMPHLLEDSYRSYTHANLAELFASQSLDLPARFQTPTKLNTSRDSAPSPATKPEWWVAADKAKGDTLGNLATNYTKQKAW